MEEARRFSIDSARLDVGWYEHDDLDATISHAPMHAFRVHQVNLDTFGISLTNKKKPRETIPSERFGKFWALLFFSVIDYYHTA